MNETYNDEKEFQKCFDIDFMKTVLKIFIDDPLILMKAKEHLKVGYFLTEQLQWVYKNVLSYYIEYQKPITEQVFSIKLNDIYLKNSDFQLLEYIQVVRSILNLNVKEKEFLVNRLEEWIKRNIFVQSFEKAKLSFNKGKSEEAFQLVKTGLDEITKIKFDAEERSFFFQEYNDRITKRKNKVESEKFPTGIKRLDALTNGGLARGELGIVLAGPKTGKSICLVNFGANTIRSFKKVLHIQLEGLKNQIEDRYEANLLRENYNEIKRGSILPDKYEHEYKIFNNNLVIRMFGSEWSYTIYDIEKEIIELKSRDFIPDMIVVDYGDLLRSRTESNGNTYLEQQEVFRDLKTLAIKYNVPVWTATQTSRAPQQKEPTKDSTFFWTRNNIADSFAKVRVCDLLITLNRTDDESKFNKLRIYVDAYRDEACGLVIPIKTNYPCMQFCINDLEKKDL